MPPCTMASRMPCWRARLTSWPSSGRASSRLRLSSSQRGLSSMAVARYSLRRWLSIHCSARAMAGPLS
ncbi:hypothetical protein D3C72_1434100 [compost metagenome]